MPGLGRSYSRQAAGRTSCCSVGCFFSSSAAAMHWAQSHTLVAGAIWYICTPVLVQPKVSHFFTGPLLIELQVETRRGFPASGYLLGVVCLGLSPSWMFADQTGRGKTPRFPGPDGLKLKHNCRIRRPSSGMVLVGPPQQRHWQPNLYRGGRSLYIAGSGFNANRQATLLAVLQR